jgi:uncharacterized integral membrane protein
MIDWYFVGFGTLWILGLGFVVASLSYANYLANQHQRRFIKKILEIPACRFMINLGLLFFCVGWAGSAVATWERLVWAILALIFVLRTWQRGRKSSV